MSFAGAIRKSYIDAITNSKEEELRASNSADMHFLNALNHYLESENESLILERDVRVVPRDIVASLSKALHYSAIFQPDHAFMDEGEVSARCQASEKLHHLSDLYRALHEYRLAADQNFNPQEERMKLWHLKQRRQSDGVVERKIEETQKLDLNSRVIVIAPGTSTLHDRLDGIESYFQQVELILGGKKGSASQDTPPAQLYCLSYPYLGRAEQESNIFAANADPYHYISPMVQRWVDETLLPSLGIEAEARLTTQQLKQSLRKLCFYSISYGSVIVQQVRNAMVKSLKEQGYSAQQLREALPQIYAQHINPVQRLLPETPKEGLFSSLYVVSSNDIVSQGNADYGAFVREAEAVGKEAKGVKINDHTWLNWTNAPLAGINVTKLEAGLVDTDTKPAREASHLVPRGHLTQLGHHSELTAHHSMIAGAHGKISYHWKTDIHNSLRWAVSGKDLPEDLTQTFNPCYLVEVSPEEKAKDNARLKKGGRA